jgi:hypothetical protein
MILERANVLLAAGVLTVVVLSCDGCGNDPVKPVEPPRITQFSAAPSDIMPGDSSLISYAVTGADSVKLYPDGVKLSPPSSGQHWVEPPVPTTYGLVGYNRGGKDSASLTISMSGAVPAIELFDLTEDTILIGNSTTLSWRTVRADSIVINNGVGRMPEVDSGQTTVTPTASTTYRAIAYNQIGTDTATATARVEIPYAVDAAYGLHYKGVMGDGIHEPEFRFRVIDQAGLVLRKPRLYFSVVDGDGTLSVDSALPDANGQILNDYVFAGQLGYGVVRAMLPDIDTLDVKVRASVLRFGADGQGQYVKLYDTYADVFALNGAPVRIDPDPRPEYELNYVVYETTLGLVLVVFDLNNDNVVQGGEPVVEVIVNTVFAENSPEGIGINSSIQDVRAAYGPPDAFVPDNDYPTDLKMIYNSLGVLFYVSSVLPDTAVFEIHLWDPTPPVSSTSVTSQTSWSRTYRPAQLRAFRRR